MDHKPDRLRRHSNPGRSNNVGPAGESSNSDIGRIESGQPTSGPNDLGEVSSKVDNPGSDRPSEFGEGVNARVTHLARSDCPYPVGGPEADQWLEGWEHQDRAASA